MGNLSSKPSIIRVNISRDGLSAYLYLEPSVRGDQPLFHDVMKRIENAHITYGLDTSKVQEMLRAGVFKRKELIAKGKPAVTGRDGRLEYFVDTKPKLKPKELEDGRVDHRDLGFLINVEKGQKLVQRIPPVEGASGWTVTGQEIPAPPVKDVKLPVGINTEPANNDPNLLIAATNGIVSLSGNIMNVLQEKTIKGDIDYSTGNLDFSGTLRINGSIKSGFKVKARGNIEVSGQIEDAEVESGEDIIIRGGFTGNGKGFVRAGKDVRVKFISNQHVYAGGSVVIENEAMNATIDAGSQVVVEGDGTLVGGKVYAPNGLKVKVLGGVHETATEVYIGTSKKLMEEAEKLKRRKEKLVEIIEDLKVQIFEIVKSHIDNFKTETPEFQEKIKNMKNRQHALKAELNTIEKREATVNQERNQFKHARVEVAQKIFIGVVIHYGDLTRTFKQLTRGGTIAPRDDKLVIL